MRVKFILALLLAILARPSAVRAEAGLVALPAEPVIEESLIPEPPSPRFQFVPRVSIFTPMTFSLTNDHYLSNYQDTLAGMPAIFLGGAVRIGQIGGFEVSGLAQIGYGTKGGNYQVQQRSAVGAILDTPIVDNIRLHWVPASIGARVLYQIPGLSFLRPTLTAGIGAQMIAQRGNLPGFDQTFVIPFLHITPALTFLDAIHGVDWFGGFSFGYSYLTSFGSDQSFSGTSVDLSFNVLL